MRQKYKDRFREVAVRLASQHGAANARRSTPGKKAPILLPKHIEQVEQFIAAESRYPVADQLGFRLSLYAGLRAGEIVQMSIADLVERDGSISSTVTVRPDIGKGGRGRSIPMHPKIADAARTFLKFHPDMPFIAFARRGWRRGDPPKRQSVSSYTNYVHRMYRLAGLSSHSSHSGRRTFITNLARNLGKDFSIRDVQVLAGHARLETTQEYVEPSDNMSSLVGRLK